MVEEGLEPEVIKIFEHVQAGESFLLSGGAGSGKTYSLVQVIKKAIDENPNARIACMTYTNAAVKEIERRVNHNNLSVTTIHDFLWDNIKSYQKDLKKNLIKLINDATSGVKSPDGTVSADYYNDLKEGIQYKEWTKIRDGIISHDEIIKLANEMFKQSKLLCDILKDRYKFVFIDEYQDTHPLVVEIFLRHLRKSTKRNTIGFFGDAMQSIYDDTVGNLNVYIAEGLVKEVKKEQNRRNPSLVINLANFLRTDGLTQVPSTDPTAPNMIENIVKEGNIKFVYSTSTDIDAIKSAIGWDFTNSKQTKELNLTHNLIAPRAGFFELMDIYNSDKLLDYKKKITDYIKANNIETDLSELTFGEVIAKLGVDPTPMQTDFLNANPGLFIEAKSLNFDAFSKIYLDKEALVDDKKHDIGDEGKKGSKRDALIKHLFKIENNIYLYNQNKYNEFVRKTEFTINNGLAKRDIKTVIDQLSNMSGNTIESVIDFADAKGLCKKDDKLTRFISEHEYVYNRVKKIKYKEFQNLYAYLEGQTPFSTQHKIKGEEFENVLVVLNNGGWNNYNFEYLFNPSIVSSLTATKQKSFPNILSRTQKIFYVCCTRAKNNLVVYYNNPTPEVIIQAKQWFGINNVFQID